MQKEILPLLIVCLCLIFGTQVSAQEQLANNFFTLRLNSLGITSLKRTIDAFDTDYIRRKSVLGDIMVRYRMGNGKWQEVAAHGNDIGA